MNELCLLNTPPRLVALQQSIEREARCAITYYAFPGITIEAGSGFNQQGFFIVFKNTFRDITLCHELLHLELLKDGYPIFEKRDPDQHHRADYVYDAINNICSIIQHKIIYKKMLSYGYDPYHDLIAKANAQFLHTFNSQSLPFIAQYLFDAPLQLQSHYLRLLCEIPHTEAAASLGNELKRLSPKHFALAHETATHINATIIESPAQALSATQHALIAFGFTPDIAIPRYYTPEP